MTEHNDGGPAFPVHGGHHPDDDPRNHTLGGGMTLRDWFAGQQDVTAWTFPDTKSVAQFLNEAEPPDDDFAALIAMTFRLQAKLKYMAADAMLEARK